MLLLQPKVKLVSLALALALLLLSLELLILSESFGRGENAPMRFGKQARWFPSLLSYCRRKREVVGRSKWLGSFFAMAHCARRSCQGGQIFGFLVVKSFYRELGV